MKVSLICTVFNEEKTVGEFLKSVFTQTKKPDEIIIVDGGSSDATASVISRLRQDFGGQANKKIKFKFIVKRGNRAVGRNEAIRNARGDIIVCSDAGCILDKNWIKNIVEPFSDSKVDVVAGYYKGVANNIFQKCLIPYVLVMPDRIDEQSFLPASRSMAFKKSIWKKLGGFPEEFSDNEDYVFAQKLKNAHSKIVFNKEAIVYWIPRNNFKDAFVMFFRFALGDSESGIIRPKVTLLFARYLVGSGLVISFFVLRSHFIIYALFFILAAYIAWSIVKNYRYVNNYLALFILPILQIISDIAIMSGTVLGFIKSLWGTQKI